MKNSQFDFEKLFLKIVKHVTIIAMGAWVFTFGSAFQDMISRLEVYFKNTPDGGNIFISTIILISLYIVGLIFLKVVPKICSIFIEDNKENTDVTNT